MGSGWGGWWPGAWSQGKNGRAVPHEFQIAEYLVLQCGAGNLACSRLSGGSFERCARLRTRYTPAESRRQPGLAAPQFAGAHLLVPAPPAGLMRAGEAVARARTGAAVPAH